MAYFLRTGADLIGLLLGHFPGSRRAAPRCRIGLRVFTPSGKLAVKIRCQGPAQRPLPKRRDLAAAVSGTEIVET